MHIRIEGITSESAREATPQELLNLHLRTHQLWGAHFEGTDKTRARNLTREDVVNAHSLLVREIARRKLVHRGEGKGKGTNDGLHRASKELIEAEGGEGEGRWITLKGGRRIFIKPKKEGAGTGRTDWWKGTDEEWKNSFGNAKREDVEEAFKLEDHDVDIECTKGLVGEYTIKGTIRDKGGNAIGSSAISGHSGAGYVHYEHVYFQPEFQGRGAASDLLAKQIAFAQSTGAKHLSLEADLTVGTYAWAKLGVEYKSKGDARKATDKFVKWCKREKIPLPNGFKGFGSAFDVATFSTGHKVKAGDLRLFKNPEVPANLEMDVGKAFMLDQSKGGHGIWKGRITFK